MNGPGFAKLELEMCFGLMNMVVDGITDEQYNWQPGGTSNSVGKSHLHALTSVDFFITATLQKGQMAWPSVAAANGLPANPMEIWSHNVDIPLAVVKQYGENVRKTALEYVGAMSEQDLDREVETPFFGKKSAAFLVQLAGMHLAGHAGDMAAVKGLQGLKGLPF